MAEAAASWSGVEYVVYATSGVIAIAMSMVLHCVSARIRMLRIACAIAAYVVLGLICLGELVHAINSVEAVRPVGRLYMSYSCITFSGSSWSVFITMCCGQCKTVGYVVHGLVATAIGALSLISIALPKDSIICAAWIVSGAAALFLFVAHVLDCYYAGCRCCSDHERVPSEDEEQELKKPGQMERRARWYIRT